MSSTTGGGGGAAGGIGRDAGFTAGLAVLVADFLAAGLPVEGAGDCAGAEVADAAQSMVPTTTHSKHASEQSAIDGRIG